MGEAHSTAGQRVIARIHPMGLGITVFFLAVILAVMVGTLHTNGWLNPEAFATGPRSRSSFILDIPFVGHALTVALAAFLACLLLQFAALALRRFDDVILDGERLFYVSRPWMGKFPIATIASVRLVDGWLKGRSKSIEILHVSRTGAGKVTKEILLTTWFYRESMEQIVANFEAVGIRVTSPPLPGQAPIWNQDADD